MARRDEVRTAVVEGLVPLLELQEQPVVGEQLAVPRANELRDVPDEPLGSPAGEDDLGIQGAAFDLHFALARPAGRENAVRVDDIAQLTAGDGSEPAGDARAVVVNVQARRGDYRGRGDRSEERRVGREGWCCMVAKCRVK